jgi:hypothetical protein
MEVLGWSAAEVAESLDSFVAAVNSALQRARATLADSGASEPARMSESQVQLLDRYVDAFQRYDVDALTSLLCEDATLSMPPYALWLRGPETIRRLVPTAACSRRGSVDRLPGRRYRDPRAGRKPALHSHAVPHLRRRASLGRALAARRPSECAIRQTRSYLDGPCGYPRVASTIRIASL